MIRRKFESGAGGLGPLLGDLPEGYRLAFVVSIGHTFAEGGINPYLKNGLGQE